MLKKYTVEVDGFRWHGENKPKGSTFYEEDTVEIITNCALGRITKEKEAAEYQRPPRIKSPPPPPPPPPPAEPENAATQQEKMKRFVRKDTADK